MKKVKSIKLIEKRNKKLDQVITDRKTKIKFMNYLIEHPEQRLWQSISNFSKFSFLLGSTHWNLDMFDPKFMEKNNVDIWDLYYYEEKNNN